jgi:hypothetical protein
MPHEREIIRFLKLPYSTSAWFEVTHNIHRPEFVDVIIYKCRSNHLENCGKCLPADMKETRHRDKILRFGSDVPRIASGPEEAAI